MSMKKKYKYKEHKCEKCGADKAVFRSFNQKNLCNKCAHEAFAKFIIALSILILIFITLKF